MAITYSLDLAEGLTREALTKLLVDADMLREVAGKLSAPDLDVTLSVPSALKIELISEAFDFRPTLELRFRIRNLGDHNAAVERIVASTVAVFRQTPADGSLLLNGETVVLTRSSGSVVLHEIGGFWSEERLELIPDPYSFAAARTI